MQFPAQKHRQQEKPRQYNFKEKLVANLYTPCSPRFSPHTFSHSSAVKTYCFLPFLSDHIHKRSQRCLPHLPSPNSSQYPCLQYQQTLTGNTSAKQVREEVSQLKNFSTPSSIPNPIPESHPQLCNRTLMAKLPHSHPLLIS